MGRIKIAVRLRTLGLGPRAATDLAAELGADAVELSADGGPFSPDALTESGRRHLMKFLSDRRLAVAALEVDTRDDPVGAEVMVARLKAVVDLAVGLGSGKVLLRAGDEALEEGEAREALAWAVGETSGYSANYATFIAIEAPTARPDALIEFIEAARGDCVGAGYDPGGQVVAGLDPAAGAAQLGRRVIHVSARDAVRLDDGTFEEVPPGLGLVGFEALADALDECDYDGFYVTGAAGGNDPAGETARAILTLRSL